MMIRQVARARVRGRGLERGNIDRRHDLVDRHRQSPPPVRMLVHGAGNIGLVDHPEQILQRYREQARSGPRQKTHHRIKIIPVDAVVAQRLGQHGERMPARVVAFAGIDPERPFQLQIAEGAPPGIAREIMGVEGDKRIGRIMIDAAKRGHDRRARTSSPDTTRCPNRPFARESLPARCRGPRR